MLGLNNRNFGFGGIIGWWQFLKFYFSPTKGKIIKHIIIICLIFHFFSCKSKLVNSKSNYLNIADSLIHVLKMDSSNLSFKYYLNGYTINNDSISLGLIQEIEYNLYQHIKKLNTLKNYSIYKKFKQMDRVYFFYSRNDTNYAIIKHYYFLDFNTKQKFRLFLKKPYWGSHSSGLFSQNEIIYDITNKAVVRNIIIYDISQFEENEKKYYKDFKKTKKPKKFNPNKSLIPDSLIHIYKLEEADAFWTLNKLMQTAKEDNDSNNIKQIQNIEKNIYLNLIKDSSWSKSKLKTHFTTCDRVYFFYKKNDSVFALVKYYNFVSQAVRKNYKNSNLFEHDYFFSTHYFVKEGHLNEYLVLFNLTAKQVEYKIKQVEGSYMK